MLDEDFWSVIHWFKDGFNDYMWEEGLSLREALQAIIGMSVGLVEEEHTRY